MPNYDLVCSKCNYKEEQFLPMSSPKINKCPKCGEKTFIRCIGSGAGIIFKGTGFFQTDYKKN